jgi:hypothetical protein
MACAWMMSASRARLDRSGGKAAPALDRGLEIDQALVETRMLAIGGVR